MNLAEYDYLLPEELIANSPAEPRDSSRLLVYKTATDEIIFDEFKNLDKYLNSNYLMVLNDTKVVPARVVLAKPTGGKVELLFLTNEPSKNGTVKAIADRKINIGDILKLHKYEFKVVDQNEKAFVLRPLFDSDLLEFLDKHGTTPIPKYLKQTKLMEKDLRGRYQSVFAQKPASVAAPTASLHFTPRILSKLKEKGIPQAHLTLHVGMGTFAPISEQNFLTKKLHAESFMIRKDQADIISRSKNDGKKILAVGTTTTRTLESQADQIFSAHNDILGVTDIFIFPPFKFKVVDSLLTNFHLPKSSLMCLVEAFLQSKKSRQSIVQIYKKAIDKRFRFYSFGDSMLIL
jgi:S-adenosylmethionine:tRNA ribosyltransferase-isomerase